MWLSGKESTCNAVDTSLIPSSGRPTGVGNSNLLQYFCLKNSMDRGAWQEPLQPWGCKKVGHDIATKQQHMYNYLEIHSFKIVLSLMPSTGLLECLLFPWEYLFENTKLPYNLWNPQDCSYKALGKNAEIRKIYVAFQFHKISTWILSM